ncbi:MAG TPA: type II secretion system protein GspJ [Gammaproteobacteria bacterium]|nr:type II secretion system protein GspJ [Gammaproteobacteria bacterium]
MRQKNSGFTLIEVMIAMAIFAIVSSLAYTGLQSVVNSKVKTEAALERLAELQMTMLTLTGDLQQLSNRDGHDALGGRLQKLTTQDSSLLIDFTRGGWRNPANQVRSTLQRVAYRIDEDKLIRIHWPHVDRADDELRVERTLITNIDSLELRFMDNRNQWVPDWPDPNAQAQAAAANQGTGGAGAAATLPLPRAIEITLKMSDWGEIKRLVSVSL